MIKAIKLISSGLGASGKAEPVDRASPTSAATNRIATSKIFRVRAVRLLHTEFMRSRLILHVEGHAPIISDYADNPGGKVESPVPICGDGPCIPSAP